MARSRSSLLRGLLSSGLLVFVLLNQADVVMGQDASVRLVETSVKSLGSVEQGALQRVALSADGTRLAWWALTPGERRPVVCDGKPGKPYDQVVSLVFSPDGKHLAYIARLEKAWFFVLNGKEVARARSWQSMAAFSPDSKHVVYQGKGKASDGSVTACLLFDGKRLPYDGTSDPVFSSDGRHLAYRADWQRSIVHDGKKTGRYEAVGVPVLSSDGRKVAYALCRREHWYLVCGSKRSDRYDKVGTPVFKPGSGVVAGKVCLGETWFILCDGEEGPKFQDVGDPVFSPNGKHLAYWAKQDGKTFILCGGNKGAEVGAVSWIGFSPDNKHLAFVTQSPMGMRLVCDGIEGPTHAEIRVPERFGDVSGKLRYVVLDGAETSLVEVDWPEDRTWRDAFGPARN